MKAQEFPLDTQLGVFWTRDELERFFDEYDWSYPIEYCAIIGDASLIFTPDVVEAMQRYKMLNTYGITSYSSDFDFLPCTWVDTLSLIDNEIQRATKAFRKLNGN